MTKVRIPTPLRKMTKEQAVVEANGMTIGEVLSDLDRQFPGIKERLCDEKGELRRFVNVYVNDQDIRFIDGLKTPVKDADEVSIIPAIAGGAKIAKGGKERKRLWLTYPKQKIQRPVIYELGHQFQVITNIRQASVTEEVGIVSLELEGERAEIKRAIAWLEELGVKVEPVEINVIEG